MLAQRAARQHGIVDADDCRAAGLSPQAVARRVAAGRLHPLFPGVYAVGHGSVVPEGRFLAAVRSCGPGTALSHISAAVLWEMLDERRHPARPVHVTTGRGARLRQGICLHRGLLDPGEVTERHGIPVTSPLRTLLDLAAVLPRPLLARSVNESLVQGLVSEVELRAAVECAEGRRGIRTLRAVLEVAGHTRSTLEDRLIALLVEGGLPRPETNVRVGPYEVDVLYRAQRVIVEADGRAFHGTPIARARDAERDAALRAWGYVVLRVTWDDVVRRSAATLRRIRADFDG